MQKHSLVTSVCWKSIRALNIIENALSGSHLVESLHFSLNTVEIDKDAVFVQ